MFTLIVLLTTVATNLRLRKVMNTKDKVLTEAKGRISNGDTWNLELYWSTILEQYGVPCLQFWISLAYRIYARLTIYNVTIFLIKSIPTAIYMYKIMKSFYGTIQERIKQKQMELEDILLQIQVVNTKLSVRDAEFAERQDELQRGAERLRRVRIRVRNIIATDEELCRALEDVAAWDNEQEINLDSAFEEDRGLIIELLRESKCDPVKRDIPERHIKKLDCGEPVPPDSNSSESSVYSAISDFDVRQDCHIKIVKVTNVYKVAYLKHFIKQKRLRRESKQAMMKKQMENIKNLLEEWQRRLSKVINSKLTILNMNEHPMDVASREAQGDYAKITDTSDSDSDMRNNSNDDLCYNEFSLGWRHNPCRTNAYGFEYAPETASSHDPQYYGDVKYSDCAPYDNVERHVMLSIVEETNSQIAIEELKSEANDDTELRNLAVV